MLTRSADRATVDLLDCSLAAADHRGLAYRLASHWEHAPPLQQNGYDRDDIAQEVLIGFHRALAGCQSAPGSSWLWTVGRRALVRLCAHLERGKRTPPLGGTFSLEGAPADGLELHQLVADEGVPDPLQELEAHERRHLVAAAVEELPESEADVVRRWSRGQTLQAIGQRRGVTHQRAQQLLAAGLRRLRKRLTTA